MTNNATSTPRKRQRADITDVAAFYAQHPETVFDSQMYATLEKKIDVMARVLSRGGSEESLEDIRQNIVEGIMESALTYVEIDGEKHFNFLQQKPDYIVKRGYAYAFVILRRQRRQASETFSPYLNNSDGEEISLWEEIEDVASTPDATRLDKLNFLGALEDNLTRQQTEVLTLLAAGVERKDVHDVMGISRQTAHKHLQKIRQKAEGLQYLLA